MGPGPGTQPLMCGSASCHKAGLSHFCSLSESIGIQTQERWHASEGRVCSSVSDCNGCVWLVVCGCLKVSPSSEVHRGACVILDTLGQCNSGLVYA